MRLCRIVAELYLRVCRCVEPYPEILPVLGLMALGLGVAIHFA